jgi:hypothetical protein
VPTYHYRFRSGGLDEALLYVEASSAFFSAVTDLHDGHHEPLAIDRDGKPWADRAAIDRCYAACRADLETRPDAMPRVLEALGTATAGLSPTTLALLCHDLRDAASSLEPTERLLNGPRARGARWDWATARRWKMMKES